MTRPLSQPPAYTTLAVPGISLPSRPSSSQSRRDPRDDERRGRSSVNICAACSHPILRGGQMAGGQAWHNACFKCPVRLFYFKTILIRHSPPSNRSGLSKAVLRLPQALRPRDRRQAIPVLRNGLRAESRYPLRSMQAGSRSWPGHQDWRYVFILRVRV